MIEIEKVILKSLVCDKEYASKVIPYIKKEYFTKPEHSFVYDVINDFVKKYNNLPTASAIIIGVEKNTLIKDEKDLQLCKKIAKELFIDSSDVYDKKWLDDVTLKFCKDQALHQALKDVIFIAEDLKNEKDDSGLSETKIPEILRQALAIDFNPSLGQDYVEDAESRFERYGRLEEKIPFYMDIFNTITNGGANRGFFHLFIGGTSAGKSLMKTSLCSDDLRLGHNALYITLELDHDIIAKRIDANLMDIDVNNVHLIGNSQYMNNIMNIKKKTLGKVVIIEDFSGKFTDKKLERILDELKLKKDFVPDKIYIDYLKKCKSSIYKQGSTNTNTYYGSISEELRNVGRKYNISIFSSMQFNRTGFSDSDAEVTDIADAWEVVQNADWVGIILNSQELQELGQIEIKQGKTKYSNGEENYRFYLGMDKNKMKVYELNGTNQTRNLNNNSGVAVLPRHQNQYSELNFD